jgi:hypothetical protein
MTLIFFDVYMQPLIEKLQELWLGVAAYDVWKPLGSRSFSLRGIVLWTIHNFLRYGVIDGVTHQGFVAFPICGPYFRGEHSIKLGKMVYTHTQRWLPIGHSYRCEGTKDNFIG